MELQELGQAIGRGIVRELADYVLIFLVLSLVLKFVSGYFGWWTDDSDKSGFDRSGLSIKTDHKTGVQYLSDGKGGMMVRVDQDGKPVIAK